MLARSVPLIQLTRPDGQPVLINIDQVLAIEPTTGLGMAGATAFLFDGKTITVTESLSNISNILGLI